MRKFWILCLVLGLASSLLAMGMDLGSERRSLNGRYRCLRVDEQLRLYRGDSLVWRSGRLSDWEIVGVSNQGRVLLRLGFEVTLLELDGRSQRWEHSGFSAWFGAGGERVCVDDKGIILVACLKPNFPRKPMTQEQLQQECLNPEADPNTLLIHALSSGQQPTAPFLRRCALIPGLRWTAVGLLARVEGAVARELPQRAPRGEEAGWLKALAIGRPELVLGELRRLRGRPDHGELFRGAISDIYESQPQRGRAHLLRFLQARGNRDEERAELIRILGLNPDPELNPMFVSLAADPSKVVGEAAVSAMIARSQWQDLLPVLRRPVGRDDILCRLGSKSIPGSLDYLRELLNQPELDPISLARVMDALRLQCRLNLGHDPARWRAWLDQRHPASSRLSEMPRSQLSGLLAAGWEGRLTDQDLRGMPRLERVLELSPRSVDMLQVDRQGEWMQEGLTSENRFTHLPTGKVVVLPKGPGIHGKTCECGVTIDLQSRLQVKVVAGQAVVRELFSGKLLQSWALEGNLWPTRRPLVAEDGCRVAISGKVWDIRSGRALFSCPEGWSKLSRSEPFCIVDDLARSYLFDMARQRKVMDLGMGGDAHFSGDGRRLIRWRNGLKIYDLAGSCLLDLKDWSGSGDVSEDARWVVDSSEAELRLIRVAGAGGTEAGTTRCRLVSLPLACRLNQEASQVLVVYAEQVVLHRVPDLQIVGQWPLSGESFREGLEWCGKRFVTRGWFLRRVWNQSGLPLSAPPEHQQLLSELWTGYRLQGGLPVALTPEQYQARCLRWRSLGGGEWAHGPRSVLPDSQAAGWLVGGSGLAVVALVWFWVALLRGCRPPGPRRANQP